MPYTPEQRRLYYQANRDKWLDYGNTAKARKNKAEWRRKNPQQAIITSVKSRAKSSGIPFSLVLEDIIIPEVCPYLKIPIKQSFGDGKSWNNPSVDRIDPSKGYTKDNIEIISSLANVMKNCATKEQLLLFAKEIINRYGTE